MAKKTERLDRWFIINALTSAQEIWEESKDQCAARGMPESLVKQFDRQISEAARIKDLLEGSDSIITIELEG